MIYYSKFKELANFFLLTLTLFSVKSLARNAPMTLVCNDSKYVEIARFAPLRQGQAIAISPSGKYLAVIGLFGRNILIYKPDGTLVRDIPRVDTYTNLSLFFRNDAELVAPAGSKAGQDAMLEIWNVEDDSPSRIIEGLYPGKGFLQ